MNYFELFGLPVQLVVDKSAISKQYFLLQKKYHPDFYTQSGEDEQTDMLEQSALINKAYKTLQQPDATIQYVLQLHGLIEVEEKYQLSNSFLMEMMDINEQLMEASMEEDATKKAAIQQELQNIQATIYAPVKAIIENYKDGVTTKEELLQVKEYYFKKKYLSRILAGLK